jgi:thiol-disulfide isomerase/thioredoxin
MTQSLAEAIPKIIEGAKTGLISNFSLQTQSQYVWKKAAWEELPVNVSLSGSYELAKKAEYEEFIKQTQELVKGAKIESEIEAKFIGTAFPVIEALKPVIDPAAVPVDVACKSGEVTLFDFWATWCGPCQGPMAHNQEMLEKHPEWAGKVRIVGVNIDDEIEAARERVTTKNWTKVDHYWSQGGWGSKIMQYFGIHGIPFCVLVDKNGLIKIAGHPMSMKLDINIPLLIEGKPIEEEKEEPQGESGNDEDVKDKAFTYEVCKPALEEFVKSHADQYSKVSDALLVTVNTKKMKNGVFQEVENFIVSRFKWGPASKAAADKIKEDLNTTFGSKTILRMQDEGLIDIKFGEKCNKCGIALGECDQFKCVVCPDVYFCIACAEQCKEPKQISDLVHPHGLFFIIKGSKELLEKGVHNCQMNEDPKMDRTHHGVGCDFCGKCPVGNRWKCLFCRDFDVCEECFRIGRDPSNPKYQETQSKKPNHIFATHSYVRLEFNHFVVCRF